jgi:flagellar assembly protein FliH
LKVIIHHDELETYRVNKYKFKLFGVDESQDGSDEEFEPLVPTKPQQAESPANDEVAAEPSVHDISTSQKDALIESLMKKTDEISSNFIKVQMQHEQSVEENKENIKRVEEESYNKGVEDGKKIQLDMLEDAKKQGVEQFSASVKTLNEKAVSFESSLESIKQELLYAALDIAKEVIQMDVCERSAEIATKLSSELIEELKDASKITLKVNPSDHGLISEQVGKLENIEVISDSAVSAGGVVALSDAGNIDSDLMKRYEKVKEVALKE